MFQNRKLSWCRYLSFYRPRPQVMPVKLCGHWQWNPLMRSRHCPPFLHGFDEQSSTSVASPQKSIIYTHRSISDKYRPMPQTCNEHADSNELITLYRGVICSGISETRIIIDIVLLITLFYYYKHYILLLDCITVLTNGVVTVLWKTAKISQNRNISTIDRKFGTWLRPADTPPNEI